MGNPTPIALNYNRTGNVYIQLPIGPESDNFNISLSVRIIDDYDGVTVYKIPKKVTVTPNYGKMNKVIDQLLSNDEKSNFITELKGGNLQRCAQNIISFTSSLNMLPYENSTTNSSDSNSTISTESEIDKQRNFRSLGRLAILNKLHNISRSDLSSVKLFSSMLSLMTRRYEENSRNLAESSIETVTELIKFLKEQYSESPKYDDILQISGGLFDAVANSLIVKIFELKNYFLY